jgi:predicted RNA-binding Zn ribbon-like protein
MRPFIRTIETLELDGGALCLNFVNSVRNRFEDPLFEFIVTPEDLLLWSCRTQIFDEDSEERLKNYVLKNQEKAISDLKKILKTRELLYRIFQQFSQKKRPADKDIWLFNKELSLVLRYLKFEIIESLETKVIWSNEPSDLLWTSLPIIKSAYELLISDSKNRIKECSNCGWLYLDKSKNNSRLWCNMKTCGNTIKIKKYYEKNKMKTKADN